MREVSQRLKNILGYSKLAYIKVSAEKMGFFHHIEYKSLSYNVKKPIPYMVFKDIQFHYIEQQKMKTFIPANPIFHSYIYRLYTVCMFNHFIKILKLLNEKNNN